MSTKKKIFLRTIEAFGPQTAEGEEFWAKVFFCFLVGREMLIKAMHSAGEVETGRIDMGSCIVILQFWCDLL